MKTHSAERCRISGHKFPSSLRGGACPFKAKQYILLGGSTGSGKSVLLKLLLIQCVKKGAMVYIADFKSGDKIVLFPHRPDAAIVAGQIRGDMNSRVCGRADKVLSKIILDSTAASEQIPNGSQGRFIAEDGMVFQGFCLMRKLYLGIADKET